MTALLLLKQLIAIDSRNTLPLASPEPRPADEMDMCAYLQEFLKPLGFDCTVSYAAERRPNLVAYRETDPKRPTLALETHMDTVGVEGAVRDLLTPQEVSGRLYGRGAADTKGTMAAQLMTLADPEVRNLPLNLMFIGTCAEETGVEGAPLLDLSPWNIDGIVVGEPTSNRLVTAHKTPLRIDLTCKGRAAHGACPDAGVNALYRMCDVIQFLRDRMLPEFAAHESAGFEGSTLAVTMIDGGIKYNIVPDRCNATVDMRLAPEAVTAEEVLASLAQRIKQETGVDVEICNVRTAPGFAVSPTLPVVQALSHGIRQTGAAPEPVTVSYCTDAGVFAANGFDAVVFGPGDIAQAHGIDEYIEISQLDEGVAILKAAAAAFARTRP